MFIANENYYMHSANVRDVCRGGFQTRPEF